MDFFFRVCIGGGWGHFCVVLLCGDQRTTCRRQFLLSILWVTRSNSAWQAWWKASLPAEPSHLYIYYFNTITTNIHTYIHMYIYIHITYIYIYIYEFLLYQNYYSLLLAFTLAYHLIKVLIFIFYHKKKSLKFHCIASSITLDQSL
jgi:hypothetical protein